MNIWVIWCTLSATHFYLIMIKAEHSERNKGPILDVLKAYIDKNASGNVFEIASGTGQHVVHFASEFPSLRFQPSDLDEKSLDSISAWTKELKLTNVNAPICFNVLDEYKGEISEFSYVININMIHISHWKTTDALMEFCAKHLKLKGLLFTYGPFMVDGKHNAPSNEQFDISLKSRNPDWGLRDISDVQKVAQSHHLTFVKAIEMPSNNFILIFSK